MQIYFFFYKLETVLAKEESKYDVLENRLKAVISSSKLQIWEATQFYLAGKGFKKLVRRNFLVRSLELFLYILLKNRRF